MRGYVFHPKAELDLEEIWDFLANNNVVAADRVISEIFTMIDYAVSTPYMGHRLADLTSKPIRFLHVRDYVIAYIPTSEPLSILAILHGRRHPRVLAAVLRDRRA